VETPFGFYKAQTASGQAAGLGFRCNSCGLQYPARAPAKFFHCGRVESAPGWLGRLGLLTVQLPYGKQSAPRALIV